MSNENPAIRGSVVPVGAIQGAISVGSYVVNDYRLTLTEITDGYRLTIQRGSETQAVELRGLFAEEIAEIRAAEQARQEAEAARAEAWEDMEDEVTQATSAATDAAAAAAQAVERIGGITFTLTDNMELEVDY